MSSKQYESECKKNTKCNECLNCKQGFSNCKKYDKKGNKQSTYLIIVDDKFISDTTNLKHAVEMYSNICNSDKRKRVKLERIP
ncbi:hypothetical protein VPHPS15B6_0080 [Vibrio phage PS15B-6]